MAHDYSVVTMRAWGLPRFEWDETRNRANKRTHGISFEEARTAFLDENARVVPDPEHSEDEERFVLLGLSIATRVWVVCRCYRQDDEDTIKYCKAPAEQNGIPCQNLINLYLRECAESAKKLTMKWG